MAGTVLVAALTLLPWHTGGPVPTPGGASGRTAIQAPDAAFGVVAALVAAGAVAWLAGAVLLPNPPVPHPRRALIVLWALVFALCGVKLAAGFDQLAVGSWTSLVLAAALVGVEVVGRQRRAVSAS